MHATTEARRELSDQADALRRIDEVLRLSRSAVWEVDRDGVFTYVSASFEDLLGYRPEELVGLRTIRDFYPKELPPELEMEITEDWIGKGEVFSQLALPLLAKSGETVWVSSSGAPIHDSEGNVVGFRGADRDITPFKKAEENLRASEQDLWRQVQAAPVPMGFTSLAGGGEFHANEAFLRTFGYHPEEIATVEAWLARAYPDTEYRAQVLRDTEEWMAQAARHELPQPREYRITCRDGSILDVEVAAALVAGKFVGTFTDVTARKRSFEQARAAEAELRRVLDNVPFPVAMSVAGADFGWTDPRAKVTFFNRRLTELFGYALSDVPTVSAWACACFPSEKYRLRIMAQIDEQVQRALAGESDVGPFEARVTAKGGRMLDVVLKAVAVGNQLVIAFEDQTDRLRARRLLEESEARLLGVIGNTPIPVAYTVSGAREMRLNKAFTDAFGWAEDDLPTVDAWFEKAYPDPHYRQQVRETWSADMERAQQTDGKIGSRVYRVTTKGGLEREVEITAALFEGEMFGTFLDQTDRNDAERQLRANEKTLRSLIEEAPVGIVRMDMASQRMWANKAFTAALGYTSEDIPTFEDWICRAYPDPLYRERVRADWTRASQEALRGNGHLEDSEVSVVAKDGRRHDMQFSGVILGDELFGMWVDMTDRNRAEQLLGEQREQLARVGRVSTLGQLAASLAHELEQPLGAILNNAEAVKLLLARETPDVAELRAIVEDILADDRRAGAVLDRIRGMVRDRPFATLEVPTADLLQEVARMVRVVAAARGIALEISCEPGTPAIQGDAVLLQQALLNLALNSVEAIGTRADGRVEMRAGEGAPGKVEISVSDNGGGVPPEKFASLLEPFYTTKPDGLGMGLPLVQSIAEQHGGKLRLVNQPGRGLGAYLTLPAHGR